MTVEIHRTFLVPGLLWAACGLLLSGSNALADNPGDDPGKVLMTINGETVRQGDFDALLRLNFGPNYSQLSDAEKATLAINRSSDTRSQLTDRTLLVSAAKSISLTATESEINAQIGAVSSELPDGMTLGDYLRGVGIDIAAFRRHATHQVLIDKLSRKRTASIPDPTDAEIAAYYREHPDYFSQKARAHVSHVLVSTIDALTDKERVTKRAEAEAVRRRLMKEGPDAFARIAGEVSNCPSKSQGGDLGMIEKGTMVAAFDEAAFSQEIGTIGKVVRTPKGYHVLKVNDRIPARDLTLDEAADDIRSVLAYKAKEEVMTAYLSSLRLSADVELPKQVPAGTNK